MPYTTTWIEPDVFITVECPHGPVKVFHTYDDNDYDDGPHGREFTTNNIQGDEEPWELSFNVHDLEFDGQPVQPEAPPYLTLADLGNSKLPTIDKRTDHTGGGFTICPVIDQDSPEYAALQERWKVHFKALEQWVEDTVRAGVLAGAVNYPTDD